MSDGTTTIRIRGEHHGIPLDVVSTLLKLVGTAYPGTMISTDTGGDVMALSIPDADRGVSDEVLAGAKDLVDQVVAETYGIEAVGMVDGALRTSPPEFLSRFVFNLAKESFAEYAEGTNYLESVVIDDSPVLQMQVPDPDRRDAGRYVVTVARSPERTPHQLRQAAEARAERAEQRVEVLEDLLHYLELHIGRYEWTQLTTEQKEVLADIVDNHRASRETGSEPMERWWR